MSFRSFGRWRIAMAVATVIGTAGMATSAGAAQEQAAPVPVVSGVASSAGVSVIYEVPQFLPLGDRIADLGIPTAQAALDTGGGRQEGFASLPNPGELVLSLPGTTAGLVGGFGSLPAPEYPLAVNSTASEPDARYSDPAGLVVLEARSAEQRVTASASVTNPGAQPSVGKVLASAVVDQDDGGTVRATAETRVEGFVLDIAGTSVRLGTITSRSETVISPGADVPTTETTFDIAGATVNGIGISIGPGGVTLGDQQLALPLDQMSDTIAGLLLGAGVTFDLVSTTNEDTGASSQYLEVTTTQPLPVPGEPEGTVIYRIGRVESSIFSGVGAEPVFIPPPQIGDAATPPSASPTPFTPPTPDPIPSVAAPSDMAAAPAVPIPTEPASVRLARDLRDVIRFFYIVLIVGGLAGLAATSLWRTKGVRARWTP